MARLDATGINELHARLPGLADLRRLLIVNELRDGQRSVGDLAGALGISQPTSAATWVLRDPGFVTNRALRQQQGLDVSRFVRQH